MTDGLSVGILDPCRLLGRVFAAGNYLDIVPVRELVLKELREAFEVARDAGVSTALTLSIVMVAWEAEKACCGNWCWRRCVLCFRVSRDRCLRCGMSNLSGLMSSG